MAAKRLKLSVTLDAEICKRVDRLAKLCRSNRSRVLEDLVIDSLEQNEAAMKAATDPVVMGAFMQALTQPGVVRGLADAIRSDLTDEQMKLFEAAMQNEFDRVILVDAPDVVRRARLVHRRGLSTAEAQRMMDAQMPASAKRPRAHIVIENEGDLMALRRAVEHVWKDLTTNAAT